MKSLFISTLVALVSLREASAAANAPFYTWPNAHSNSRSGKPEVLSHTETRLALASRLGLSQFHHIGTNVDIYKLQRIASSQKRLWTDKYETDGTVVVTIGGILNTEAFWDESPSFTVEDSPPFSDIGSLIKALSAQTENIIDSAAKSLYSNANGGFVTVVSPSSNSGIDLSPHLNEWNVFESAIGTADASRFKSNNPADVDFFEEYMVLKALADKTIEQAIAEKATIFIHLGSLDTIGSQDGVNSLKHKTALRIMSNLVNDIIKATSAYPSIVGLIPPSPKNAKRSASIELIGDFDIEKVKRKESPLAPENPKPKVSVAEEASPVTPFQKDKIVYPKPGCFETRDLCGNSTNSCNGRGKCIKSTTQSNCWSCRCNPTVAKVNGQNKTTHWGGNACQKEDVSVPFFLFTTFAIAITLAIGWTIGKMLEMGGEELPGELSAGVAIVRK
ncbi:hypothetical protein ABW19_dt0205991 [Dactylella cylindrospora]|nr:hypothetical protein ABW19_dt0205991 [Dactylella cylindrospora]